MLFFYRFLGLLPVDAVGGIRNLIPKGFSRHLVISQCVAQVCVGDVAALENCVALAKSRKTAR